MQPPETTKIKFEQKDIIGEGGYSIVFSGYFGNREVAIKRVQLPQAEDQREENAFQKLNHENVIKLLYFEQDTSFK